MTKLDEAKERLAVQRAWGRGTFWHEAKPERAVGVLTLAESVPAPPRCSLPRGVQAARPLASSPISTVPQPLTYSLSKQ